MKPYYDENSTTLYHGDCLSIMPTLSADSVDTILTDPPYGLSFMGKDWDRGVPGVHFWQEALRVAKPGAMLLAFGGTRTFHRLTCAIEDAGWEIRDCMSWLYGSGFPKSLDISKAIDKAAGMTPVATGQFKRASIQRNGHGENWEAGAFGSHPEDTKRVAITAPATAEAELWDGWGTALKPAWEPIIVAMKPTAGTFAENALAHGVAGFNIDGARIGHDEPVKETRRRFTCGQLNHRVNDGRDMMQWERSHSAEGKPQIASASPSGRWPANVVLDEVAAGMLDEQAGERPVGKGVVNRNGDRQMDGWGLDGKTVGVAYGDSGGASRFFYTAKASRSDRGAGNDHPTVKPTDLMKYLCTLTATPTGGVILDPFCGSGTTLVAAREVGRRAIGIELEESHCRIVVDRLRQLSLFAHAGGAK